MPRRILTFGLSLPVCGGVVAAEMPGCSEVAEELIRADVGPGVSATVLARVAGLPVAGTPRLVWFGSEGVPCGCVGARLGWGLGCSRPSPGELALAARDPVAASVWKKCSEKDT